MDKYLLEIAAIKVNVMDNPFAKKDETLKQDSDDATCEQQAKVEVEIAEDEFAYLQGECLNQWAYEADWEAVLC